MPQILFLLFFKERKDGIAITAEGLGDYSNGSVSVLKNSSFVLKAANTQESYWTYLSIYYFITWYETHES